MSLGPGAMVMGRCLHVTSGFTISAEPPLSLSLAARCSRSRVAAAAAAISNDLCPPARGDRGQLDSCEGTPGGGRHRTWDPGPDQWCNYSGRLQRWARGNRFLNRSFSPSAFESRYCCERCPSFAVKSEFPGHHVCSNDESGLNLVMSIQWGKTRLEAGIWNSRMMSEELMREAIRLLISSYLHSLPGDQLWDLGPLSVTRDPGYQNIIPYFQVGALRDKMHSDWGNVSQDDVIENWLRTSWMSSGTIERVDISTLE